MHRLKSNLLLILGVCLLASACSENASGPDCGNRDLASVLTIYNGDNLLFVTDYYPAFGVADSITTADGFGLQPAGEPGVYRLMAGEQSPMLGHITVWQDSKPYEIVVRNKQGMPIRHSLTAAGVQGQKLKVSFDTRPDKVIALWQNTLIPASSIIATEDGITISIPSEAKSAERSFIRVYACCEGKLFSDLLVPLKKGVVVTDAGVLDRTDRHAQIIYSLMIDRFYNGNPGNDRRLEGMDVLDEVNYQGGDIKGVTDKIEDGFFSSLGVNTIWISPITQNPDDAWGLYKEPYTTFSGYHGYWPIYTTKIDDRFGTDEEFEELLDTAHDSGMNVLLDYVANHLHIDSPVLQQNPDWVTPLMLPDGRRNLELWDEQRLTTWFDLHIPTLDMEREEVYQPMTDSALYWIANFDLDGFRHDATKHLPEVYWRTLTSKMKQRYPEKSLYQIGETYGSPQLIGSYVKTGMLDAQFDFNVYDRTIWHLANSGGSMNDIAAELRQSLDNYGYHNLMGNITGNHDRPRFISLAGGSLSFEEDSKHAGWNREVTVGDPVSYDRLELLHAIIMTIPGVPCVYQGDEYGIPGGNDPDNRRMMKFSGYNEREQTVRDNFARLAKLRRRSMPLIYGQFVQLHSDKDVWVYARTYMDDSVIIAINKGGSDKNVSVKIPAYLPVNGLRVVSGNPVKVNDNTFEITLPPVSYTILTR